MSEFVERKSGIVVPVVPPKERQLFVQESLIPSQLPGYLKRLLEAEAEIEAVFRQAGFGMGFRFCVAYMHHEELDTEIYC